nr:hypothetical protein [Tanacetum cinerariifolium]
MFSLVWIMPPRVMTQSASRPAAASRGGGTGGLAGSYSGRTRGEQGRGQRNGRNQNGDVVNDSIWGDVSRGCTYIEFLACNPKEYDGKGAGHAAYTDRFHELARLVPHIVTPEGKRIKREPRKVRNVRDDNKRTRTGNAFPIITKPIGRDNTGTVPMYTICITYHPPRAPCRTCFNCNHPGHFVKDCRVAPRNVNHINARNPVARSCYECGSTDHLKSACPRNQGNQARGRAFMLGAEEARQDLNIMTG